MARSSESLEIGRRYQAGDGRLVFDGPVADFSGALASRRLHGVVG